MSQKDEKTGLVIQQSKPEKMRKFDNTFPFDVNNPQIKQDIVRMMIQYLEQEGFLASMLTLQDEANIKLKQNRVHLEQMKRLKNAIIEGDWETTESIITRGSLKNNRNLHYAIYKQQYLEMIDNQEFQKAFIHLNKKLKPLESVAVEGEFKDLSYLLTCKSMNDGGAMFSSWQGPMVAREKLVEQISSLWNCDSHNDEETEVKDIPQGRLISLLQQAVGYQILESSHHPTVKPEVQTLLCDYECSVIPNSCRWTLNGHTSNVKCVCFTDAQGRFVCTGSSDNTVRLWETETGKQISILGSHNSRIWDLSSNNSGTILASASADSTIKLWSLSDTSIPSEDISIHKNDVYSVCFHPSGKHIASGGYDGTVKLTDIRTKQVIKTFFSGQEHSIPHVVFNPHGNLIISGCKDGTVRFWDVLSGVCVKSISGNMGEITSVQTSPDGTILLSSSKDSANRLWDLRTSKLLRRLKSHQNISKHFIRSTFCLDAKVVAGGSEDGNIYLWETETGKVIGTLQGHNETVFDVRWNSRLSLLASSSQDSTAKIWWFDPEFSV